MCGRYKKKQTHNLTGRFQRVVIDHIHILYFFIKHFFEIFPGENCFLFILQPIISQSRECTGVEPETGALCTLIDFHFELTAEAVPVEQGGFAVRAGVFRVSKQVDTVCAFDKQQGEALPRKPIV